MYRDLQPLDRSDPSLQRFPIQPCVPDPNPMAVSIAPIEVSALANRFPIAWRDAPDGWDLVAVTGLDERHDYWRPREGTSTPLPLLARAYPLAVLDDGRAEALNVFVDAAALAGTDPLDDPPQQEQIDAEIERRCQALWTYVQSRRTAQRLFRDLAAKDAFTPWNLTLPASRGPIQIQGLFVLRASFFGSAAHRDIVARHGWRAASLISLHRIATHRIRALLADLDGNAAAI